MTGWTDRRLAFALPDDRPAWMAHHAAVPLPLLTGDGRLRIYFSTRDAANRSRIAWLEADPADPARVLDLGTAPCLDLGAPGTFDDSGVMPGCLVPTDDGLLLFYTGWNVSTTVPYRTAIGVAVSRDGGRTFERRHEGPVLDRDRHDPFFVTTPFVLRTSDRWVMWYSSGTRWLEVEGRLESVYVIKRATSADGLEWHREERAAIVPLDDEEAAVRPWVVERPGGYSMWFCHRGSRNFRLASSEAYRISRADSDDGIAWRRVPEPTLEPSGTGWDATMTAYPALYEHGGTLHLLYCGDGFGRSGFGHATCAQAGMTS